LFVALVSVFALILLAILAWMLFAPPVAGRVGPVVVVEAVYPGADARTVEDTIAAPIEQQVNGVEKAVSLWSRSASDGSYRLRVTFREDADPNQAQVLVQNRVALAMPLLPDAVKQHGPAVSFDTPPAKIVVVCSPDGRYDGMYLGNLAKSKLVPEISRLPLVGQVSTVGTDDWELDVRVDGEKLSARAATMADIVAALKAEIAALAKAAGETDESALEKIVVKTPPGGPPIRLGDVASVRLAAKQPFRFAALDGVPVVVLVIRPAVDAKAALLDEGLRRRLSLLKPELPQGVTLDTFFTSPGVGGAKSDRGDYLVVEAAFPDAASMERISAGLAHFASDLRNTLGVKSTLVVSENPFAPFRTGPCVLLRLAGAGSRDRKATAENIRRLAPHMRDFIFCVGDLSPTHDGASPMEMAILDMGDRGRRALGAYAESFAERLRKSSELVDVYVDRSFDDLRPPLVLDRRSTLRAALSPNESGAFPDVFGGEVGPIRWFNQSLPVRLSLAPAAKRPWEALAPYEAADDRGLPAHVDRFNMYPMVHVVARPAAGVSVAQAWARCRAEAAADSRGYQLDWLSSQPEPGVKRQATFPR